VLGDTNPIATFGPRITNPETATSTFLLGADSAADLDFTNYPNMRLGAYNVLTPTGTPASPSTATTFTGSITPAGGTYRFGGPLTVIGNNQASATLVLARQNQLTGANGLNMGPGGLTLIANNNFSGATTLSNALPSGSDSVMLGIGNDAVLGTSAVTFTGGATFRWGGVNGDHTVSNNIAWDPASTANWVPNANTANDSIFRNTSQTTLSYLGQINLNGRSTLLLTFRQGGALFLGDFTGGTSGYSIAQSAPGYLSMLSTPGNGGTAKTYSGQTTINVNGTLVVDSDASLGTGGTLALGSGTAAGSQTLQIQPGTASVNLGTRGVLIAGGSSTAIVTPNFNVPANSTLTLGGAITNSVGTAGLIKTGLGTMALTAQSPNATTTGTLQVNSGTLRLDAATAGGTVWGAANQPLILGINSTTFGNGGTLEITGTFAQSFGAVTVNPRANAINLTGAMALTLGGVTRTSGSTLNLSVPTGTVASSTAAVAGLVNGATTWNGNDWAAARVTALLEVPSTR
jgi:autotransporter-associated beta strand protein